MSTTPAFAAAKAAAARPTPSPAASSSADGKAVADSVAVADLKAGADRSEITVDTVNACTTERQLDDLAEKIRASNEALDARLETEKKREQDLATSLDKLPCSLTYCRLHAYLGTLTLYLDDAKYRDFSAELKKDEESSKQHSKEVDDNLRGMDQGKIKKGAFTEDTERAKFVSAFGVSIKYGEIKPRYEHNLAYFTAINAARVTLDSIIQTKTAIEAEMDKLSTLFNDDIERRRSEIIAADAAEKPVSSAGPSSR
jgi:hypothetical protein